MSSAGTDQGRALGKVKDKTLGEVWNIGYDGGQGSTQGQGLRTQWKEWQLEI